MLFEQSSSMLSRIQLFVLSAAAMLLMLPDRLAVWSVACIGLAWLLGVREYGFPKRISKAVFIPVALLGAFIFGLIHTTDLARGLFEIETRLALIVPLFIATIQGLSKKKLQFTLRVFAWSVLIVTIFNVGLGLYLNASLTEGLSYLSGSRMTNLIGKHPTYLTLYIVAAIFVFAREKRFLLFNWLVILWLLQYSVMAASRSSLLLVACIVIPICIFILSKNKNIKIGLVLGILMAGLLFVSFQSNSFLKQRTKQLIHTKQETTISQSDTIRVSRDPRSEIWRASVAAISSQPFIGHGTGDGKAALRQAFIERHYKLGSQRNYNPHNQYLQTGIQLGIPGILLTILFVFAPLIYCIKHRKIVFASVWLIVSSLCLIESILERQQGLLFVVVLYGLTFHQLLSIEKSKE